jgi:hypothetical protein
LADKKSELDARYGRHINTDPLFYSRNQGITHICFPDLVPNGFLPPPPNLEHYQTIMYLFNHQFAAIGSYSKFGSVCITNTDFWPDAAQTQRYNGAQVIF